MLNFLLLAALAQDKPEPLTPQETASGLRAPEGFAVTLFAGEPDVRQPISFAFDDRGRIWVAEAYSYPKWDPPGKDRVLIFEDTDGDGRHDKRSVFCEGFTYITGIEVGFGGLWVIAPPRMLFVPDRDGDDKPDGPPEVLLDGFGNQGGHNIATGFTWGPDGWLYAGHGRTSLSDLGKPGTPMDQRLHFDGGVWRYHPTRHVVEAFADGTTNPWGVSFDDHGQALISNCVNPHLFHAIQGAHFEPWRGRESSRFAYRRIDSIADHLHWVGRLENSRGGPEVQLAAGGGHAHCGCMVYLGDSFPDAYRNTVMMSNLHGHRINHDLPARRGSGFTASHGKDFLVSQDRMFTALHLNYGADGAVTLIDWYDRGECHTRDPHRESGRIYKVTYKGTPPARPDLAKLPNDELVRLQLHKNDWYVTHARRLLQERKADVAPALLKILDENPDETRKLRALWALHATDALTAGKRVELLSSPHEYVRAWAIQLEAEDRDVPAAVLAKWVEMSRTDPSPVVRLYLASACRRLTFERTLDLLSGLASHAEDADDPNLPLMTWYAAWPMAEKRPDRALAFVRDAKVPLLREFMTRQLAMLAPAQPRRLPVDAPTGTVAFSSVAPRGWDVYFHDRETGKTAKLTDSPANDYNAVLTNDGKKVAFVSERDGNAELYACNADGSSPRRLTDSVAYDDHAAWSPDGRSILFSSTREAPSKDGQAWNALYVMSSDGQGVQRISPVGASDYSPAWYGWGDVIACATGSGESGRTDIVVMKPDGSERRKVAEDGGWPTFPQGGRTVYFHSKRDGSWGIWRVNPDGTGLQRITPKEIEATMPRGASHAKLLAMVVKRGAHRQIEVMDLDSRKLTPITTNAADHWNPSLSSDGKLVTWHQAAPGEPPNVETWTTPEGTKLRMLRVAGAFPAFAPEGKRVALTGGSFASVDVMNLDGTDRKTLHKGQSRGLFSLSWSHGDERIAFSLGGVFQGAEGKVEIATVKPDGSEFREITKDTGNDGFPSFSPDGSRLVFRSGRDGAKNLYTMRADGTDVRRLTEGKWTDTMCDWSPQGDWIAFASDRGGSFEIWLVQPDGSGLRKLVGGGGRNNHPHFSPDGRWVVFTSQRAGYSAEEVSLPHQPQPYGDLFAIRTDGRDLLRLTHTPFEEGTPAWGR